MKKTQTIEALRNIRRNRVSFLSIVFISMLAVVAYLGLSFSAEGIRKSADATYEAEKIADIEISASALLSDSDLEKIRAAQGVLDAEGIVYLPSRVVKEKDIMDIVLRSLSSRISLPHVTEGHLPENESECAVETALAEKMGYSIGDQINLASRSAKTDILIKNKAFTVTGLFTAADHLTDMISFEPTVLVTRGAFHAMMLPEGRYTRLLVRVQAENPGRFSSLRVEEVDGIKHQLEAINGQWIVTALHNTPGYICTKEDADLLSTVSVTFSMLFILIAALVIYSTISRLVTGESRLVGATKAMGLKNSEIFAKYLLFGSGGAILGALIGILLAYAAFERIVLFFFAVVFTLGEWTLAFQPLPALIVAAGAALLSVAAVFLACRKLLKSTAVSLMNGQSSLWRPRKSVSASQGALYIRLMLRNMRADWRRVCVSIVSIAGCCMLLLIGFYLKFAISRVPEKQYGEIQRFDMEVALDDSAAEQAAAGIEEALDAENVPHMRIFTDGIPYKAGGEPGLLTLIAPDGDQGAADFYDFRDVQSGAALAVPSSGALVSRMFATQYQLSIGDRFSLYDSSMRESEAEVAGIFENYIGINIVCSLPYAEKCLGEKLTGNVILLRAEGKDPDALRQRLTGMDGFVSLSSARKQQALFDGLSSMLNLVILMLGTLAVMIACFILLNLVSTYVTQKKNELTIMRINGYTTGETIRYASMECYGITALGILLGLALGQGFCAFLIRLIEQLSIGFVKEPTWVSFVASALITAVISGVIHYFAFRKIRTLKLSDIQR